MVRKNCAQSLLISCHGKSSNYYLKQGAPFSVNSIILKLWNDEKMLDCRQVDPFSERMQVEKVATRRVGERGLFSNSIQLRLIVSHEWIRHQTMNGPRRYLAGYAFRKVFLANGLHAEIQPTQLYLVTVIFGCDTHYSCVLATNNNR